MSIPKIEEARNNLSSKAPYSLADERFYIRLAERSGWHHGDNLAKTARLLWRVLHAWPLLESGRIWEMRDRVYGVPSTRAQGRVWLADLKAMKCRDSHTGKRCPDQLYRRKTRCAHIQAAILKENQLLDHNKENVMIFPDARRPTGMLQSERAAVGGASL